MDKETQDELIKARIRHLNLENLVSRLVLYLMDRDNCDIKELDGIMKIFDDGKGE